MHTNTMIDVKAVFRSFLVKSDPKNCNKSRQNKLLSHTKKELLQKKCKRDNLPNITFHLVDHLYIVMESHLVLPVFQQHLLCNSNAEVFCFVKDFLAHLMPFLNSI